MKDNIDKLTNLLIEGRNAYKQLNGFYEAVVPFRNLHNSPVIGRNGILDYPPKEPEHEKTIELLQTARSHTQSWNNDVISILNIIDRARYIMQFNDPNGKSSLLAIGELTKNEQEFTDILIEFELRLDEVRKIIIDYESSVEKIVNSEPTLEPATYDPKKRTIFFADEAIRFNKNAEYQPAICKLIFEKPEKLWELKDFLSVWDSLYDYLPDLQKPTDWNKVYDAIKKINARVANATNIADLFQLSTGSVRLSPKYITPSKK